MKSRTLSRLNILAIPGSGVFIALSVLVWVISISIVGAIAATASCDTSHVRYASSNNRLYIENGGDCTLEEASAIRPNELVRTENGTGDIFFARAYIYITDGSTLRIYGPGFGGEVGQLRLLSNNAPDESNFIFMTADWGIIDIRSTEILSWDENAAGPDETPADKDDTVSERAYINAISRKDPDTGVITESRLDIRDSVVHHLGYQGNQAYGLSWKTILKSGQGIELLDEFDVFGDVVNNEIHHLHYGFYSFGAYAMNITDNEIYENNVYGIDPHDDSDFLVISRNNVHHNGRHGIICSKRCNNLSITDNISSDNVEHGIMLHIIVDHSLVAGNTSKNNGDTGIVLYESNHNIVRNNTVEGNKHGIRLSMGSSFNLIEDNIVKDNTANGLLTFQGNNDPTRTVDGSAALCDTINRSNTFRNNQVSGSGAESVRMSDSDKNLLRNNDIAGSTVKISSGRNNMFVDNQFTGDPIFTLNDNGNTTRPSLVYLAGPDNFIIDAEAGSQGIILGN